MAPTILASRRGEYATLEAVLPGRPPAVIGVVLLDPVENRLGVRVRRDWEAVAGPEDAEALEALESDLRARAAEMGGADLLASLEDTLSNAVRISPREPVLLGDFAATLERLYQRLVPATLKKYETHLPLYSCRAAAGRFGEQMQVEEEGWIEAPPGAPLREGMFVAQVVGRSMEPRIPDGSLCVFRSPVVGSRHGRLVLVENLDESESGGERYTVKRYHRPPGARTVTMQPLNPEFPTWTIDEELAEAGRIRVIAEFLATLG